VNVYLDASVLVALFTRDAFTQRANDFLDAALPILAVSDFAAAEFASAVARMTRTREITLDEARSILADFDVSRSRVADEPDIVPADVAVAASFIRRLDLTLRTADGINIAIAQRVGALLATFDIKMAASARAVGTAIADA
jgi:predicted nucleic acid-binding protein